MIPADDNQTLPSLYDHHDDTSGIRPIPRDQVVLIFDELTDAPSPVYAIATSDGSDRPRRYYVGVRFVEGIIPSAEWEAPMKSEGVSPEAIEQTWRLLHESAL